MRAGSSAAADAWLAPRGVVTVDDVAERIEQRVLGDHINPLGVPPTEVVNG